MSGFLSRILFPVACPVCSRLDKAEQVEYHGCCDACYKKYVYRQKNAIVVLPEFAPACSQVVCCSFYGDEMRDAMQKFKFQGATYMGENFGKIMFSVLKESGCLENTDVITAVPISRQRFRARGYNQCVLIAKELSKLSRIRYMELLERTVQGDAQSSLLLKERRQAAEGRFAIIAENQYKIKGKAVLLVDDILTSGSTVDQCGRILKEAGAAWVTAACVTGGRKDFM